MMHDWAVPIALDMCWIALHSAPANLKFLTDGKTAIAESAKCFDELLRHICGNEIKERISQVLFGFEVHRQVNQGVFFCKTTIVNEFQQHVACVSFWYVP